MSTLQPFVWNSFINWQSDDDYEVSRWQFVFSENVDVKQTWFRYWLTPKPVKINFVNAQINWFIWLESTAWNKKLYYFWDAWKVFNDSSTDNTSEFTTTWWYSVLNAFEFGAYVYFVSSNSTTCKIYRDTKANLIAETYAWADFTPTWDAIPAPWFSNCNWVVYSDSLILWIGKYVYEIDSSWVWTNIFIAPDDIMWITTVADLLKIYLRNGSVYYINPADATFPEYRPLWIKIRNVVSINGIDYILWWTWTSDSELYRMNWYTPEIMRRAKRSIFTYPMWIAWDKWEFQKNNFRPYMAQVQDDLLLVDNWVHYDRITHYGNVNDIFPRVFSNIIATNSQWRNSRVITAMYYWDSKIYYYYNDLTTSWVDSVSITSWSPYQTNWFIFTEVFDAWIRSKKKKNLEIVFKCDNISTWNEAILSYTLDGSTYTTIGTLSSSNRLIANTPIEFYKIQFRIELKQAARFEELTLKYQIVENV